MRQSVIALSALVLLAATALARDSRKELAVDLSFRPQEGVNSNSPDLTPGALERTIAFRVEDGRGAEPAADIGQGTNDEDETFPIRATTDVIAYVGDTVGAIASSWGVRTAEKPERILTLRLTRFNVEESNKAVGSVYAAEVKFTYVLADASGKKLIEGASSGSAHRYGRARSAENSNEVLSDSLKEAFANALSDPRLQESWSSGRAGSAAGAASGDSVEERLRKLDELLKKKLITKQEYDKKRAEILEDV
jgi:hypothetical protein